MSDASEVRYGVVYDVKPEPLDPSATTWVEAGAVRFGIESRNVTPESLREAYKDDPEGLAEIEASSPEGGFSDEGVSIHVLGAEDGHEYLRFDAFAGDPHYHYIHRAGDRNHWVPFDDVAGGDMVEFALGCLRDRLAAMLSEAGGEAVAASLDARVQATAVDEVARRIRSLESAS